MTSSARRHHSARPLRPASRAPLPRLRGSAAILRYLATTYAGSDVGPGVVVALVLDADSMLIAHGRLRDLPHDLDLPPATRAGLTAALLGELRHGHPDGGQGRACLLVAIRSGAPRLGDADLGWWAALRAAGATPDLEALDVLVSAPAGWRTVVAGTRGSGDWPPAVAL